MTVLVLDLTSRNRIGCGLFDITDFCGHGVHKLPIEDVCFSDCIRCGGLNGLTGSNIFKLALLKGHAFDLCEGDRPCFVIDVGSSDGEGDFISELKLAFLMALAHDQIIVDRTTANASVIGDRQRAFDLCDIVVARLRTLVQRIGKGVRALADQCLAARHIIGCAFATHEAVAAYRNIGLRVLR